MSGHGEDDAGVEFEDSVEVKVRATVPIKLRSDADYALAAVEVARELELDQDALWDRALVAIFALAALRGTTAGTVLRVLVDHEMDVDAQLLVAQLIHLRLALS